MDLELELFGDLKEKSSNSGAGGGGIGSGSVVSGVAPSAPPGAAAAPSANSVAMGKVFMLSLSSQPVDHEDAASGGRTKVRLFQQFEPINNSGSRKKYSWHG
jgi:hypothetical protein